MILRQVLLSSLTLQLAFHCGTLAHARTIRSSDKDVSRDDPVARALEFVPPHSQSRTVLVLRVSSASIGSPSVSKDELYLRIFSDSNSLKHQMARCSTGQMQLNPTNFGVLDVVIDGVNTATPREQLVEKASEVALQLINNNIRSFGGSQMISIKDAAHHVMFVMPDRGDGFVASAEICPKQQAGTSVFGDTSAVSLSVLLHEIGHNLSLNHARGMDDVDVYADQTGNMGHSINEVGGPLACYNAANHWTLEWYKDSRIDFETPPSIPTSIAVAAFVDYDKVRVASFSSNDPPHAVLVKVGPNLFLQYNRAKGYNSGTRDMVDKLVLVRQRQGNNNSNSGGTVFVAGLDLSNPTYSDRSSVTIRVCRVHISPTTGIESMVVNVGRTDVSCNLDISAGGGGGQPDPQPAAASTDSDESIFATANQFRPVANAAYNSNGNGETDKSTSESENHDSNNSSLRGKWLSRVSNAWDGHYGKNEGDSANWW